MITLEYLQSNDIKDEEEASPVRNYFKQSGINKNYALMYVVKNPDNDTLIAVMRELKWSPYSDRGRVQLATFYPGETAPRTIRVSDLDYDEDKANKAVITLAKENERLKDALLTGKSFDIQDALAGLEKVPYVIVSRLDLNLITSELRAASTL